MSKDKTGFAPSYTLTLYFLSRDGRRSTKKVYEGLTWLTGMDKKDSMLNVDTCMGAFLEPCWK